MSTKLAMLQSKVEQVDNLKEAEHQLMEEKTALESEKQHIDKQLQSALERELQVG